MPYGLRGLGDSPMGIVAVMPPVLPGACNANQIYIPPGGKFTSGWMAGQITPTGGCQDNFLTAGACSAGQTFIPPGGKFTSGPMAGQATAYGACQDAAAGTPPGTVMPGAGTDGAASTFSGFSLSDIPWWGWGLAAAGALFAFGGKH